MAIKLIKACKDLNIGMSTAVEYLQKQGQDISVDPNVRIDDDLYMMLAKEFNKDMALKMEAERLQKERHEREVPTTVTVEPEKKAEPQPAPVQPKVEVQKPKVLGKIDLDAKKPVVKQEAVDKEEKKQEPVKPAPVQETKKEEQPVVKPAAEPKPQPQQPVEPKPVQPKEEPKAEPAPVVQQPAKEEPQAKKQEPEVFTLGKPVLKNVPKVVGKIDLDTLNQQTHPKQKTKEQKKKEREERRQQQHGGQNQQNANRTAGATNDANSDNKRKRERIKQGKVDVNNPDFRKGGKGQKGKRPIKVEVDDEEVQRQIKETIARLQGGKGKNAGAKYRKEKRELIRQQQEEMLEQEVAQSKVLKLTEFVTANELATMMNISVNQVIGTCMSLGLMVSINQRLDAETINIVAEEFGYSTEFVSAKVVADIADDSEEYSDDDLEPRCYRYGDGTCGPW